MIRPLRKRHLYTWVVLAIVVPIIFGAVALTNRSMPENDSWSQQSKKQPQELVLFQTEEANIMLKIVQVPGNSLRNVEFDILAPLTGTSALVYWVPAGDDVKKGSLLGQLGPRGHYRFALDSTISQQSVGHIIIYDQLKQSNLWDFSVIIGE